MTNIHDDMPHPVPPTAYLRYKENWFFLIMDKTNNVFGAIHVNSEPGFDRIRFASHLNIEGEIFTYSNLLPFPEKFGFAKELGDGKFTVRFVKAHERIDLSLHDENVDMEMSFLNRSPLFNFDEYDHANPDKVGLRELSTLATNLQHVHQQQGMFAKGEVKVKQGGSKGKTFKVDALGYRDHSRSFRCDSINAKHYWTGMLFPNHVFGVVSATSIPRPEAPTNCGYVYGDEDGLRPLREVSITSTGNGPGGMPATVEFNLTDIYDKPFTIIADLSKRYAHVPLHTEAPGATPFVYDIVENFAPLTLKETGETGIGLIEVGWSTPKKK